MREVQSFILNLSFPRDFDTLSEWLESHGPHFNVNDILEKNNEMVWTAPRWAKAGDIVFFMHSKTSISSITRLRTEFRSNIDSYSKEERDLFEGGFNLAIKNYQEYGGKIFAIGKINDQPSYDYNEKEDMEHWKGRIYAPVSDIIVLQNPIDISAFNDSILVSRQSAITGIFGKEFDKLKEIIINKNVTNDYFEKSISTALPIKNINKTNWLNLTYKHRRGFFLESQFRSYYTDFLLKELSDNKVYAECLCKTDGKPDCRVDNVIFCNNKPLLVEIKLNINIEKDLPGQMTKYCNCDSIIIGGKNIINDGSIFENAIIIDTEKIYTFDNKTKSIEELIELDSLKNANDIKKLKSGL